MGRYGFYILLALTAVWVTLVENLTWQSLAVGLLTGAFCTYFSDIFLPPIEQAKTVKVSKLSFFPLWLIGQVYISGFQMVKFVVKGANFDFVNLKTELKSETLKALLMEAITFVPGSIAVEVKGDTIMTLALYDKNLDINDPEDHKVIIKWIASGIEKKLEKAQILEEGAQNQYG